MTIKSTKRTELPLSSLRSFPFFQKAGLSFSVAEIERTLSWEESATASEGGVKLDLRIIGSENLSQTEESLRIQSAAALISSESDYTLLAPSGTIFNPSAVYILSRKIAECSADIIYWDEGVLSQGTIGRVLTKREPSRIAALGRPYLGQVALVRSSLLKQTESTSTLAILWELSLRELKLTYLPLVLSSSPTPISIGERELCSIAKAIEQSKILNSAQISEVKFVTQNLIPATTFRLHDKGESVAVIIPFRNSSELTLKALRSVSAQKNAAELELVLIDNGSEAAELRAVLEYSGSKSFKSFTVLSDPDYFNFARICNLGMKKALELGARRILFLNNDVELVGSTAILELSAFLVLESIGIAGGGLTYPGGRIQSSGISQFGPTNIRLPQHFPETFRVVDAVSLGFAMIRAELLEKSAGLDEKTCPNGFGDVLFGAKAKELGYLSVIVPWIKGVHDESKSRGRRAEELELYELESRRDNSYPPESLTPYIPTSGAFNSIVKHVSQSPTLFGIAENLSRAVLSIGRVLRRLAP